MAQLDSCKLSCISWSTLEDEEVKDEADDDSVFIELGMHPAELLGVTRFLETEEEEERCNLLSKTDEEDEDVDNTDEEDEDVERGNTEFGVDPLSLKLLLLLFKALLLLFSIVKSDNTELVFDSLFTHGDFKSEEISDV